MKIYILISLLGILVLLGSCLNLTEPDPPRAEPWLCSINADGTGFRKIKKVDSSFGTNGFWDIYMTKDDRIIFYGEKLWISDTDSINVVPITPDNLIVFNAPQLEFTQDGGTAFFAASRDLYKIKLSTNELFKITETPDYTYAEPLLSDDERYLTMRSYAYNGKEPRKVGAYIDLLDNSLRYIYSNTWFPARYKDKIMTGMNKLILENRDGLGSVSLQDSIFTLHQEYGASYKSMLEVTTDQRYLLTRYIQSAESYAIAIDLHNNTRYELGRINDNESSNPIKVCKSINIVYYMDEEHIYKYDLDNHTKSTVFGPSAKVGVYRLYKLAPTWDGSKIYFDAEIVTR
ncbi:MAG: hypothetical protein LHW56_06205 [Candidatus Cloacimonetes bacterium]|jgi:hypothetical protein|nr:hypothetical protein [Candidatus Cloacimonadota bacterium]MDY0172484.1 hypothetical protein [Candidatus Cloacimonadaceae bacterium]